MSTLFVVDSRENVLRIGQVKIKFCTDEMLRSANHSIRQVTVAEEGVNRCGEEEPLVLDAETEDELVDELPDCVITEVVIVAERLILVSKLKKASMGETAEEKELVADKEDVGAGTKDVRDAQRTDEFGDGMTPVTGSEMLLKRMLRKSLEANWKIKTESNGK